MCQQLAIPLYQEGIKGCVVFGGEDLVNEGDEGLLVH
jgi:hypothetical protein